MVARRRDPADGRRQVVSLSPAGRALLDSTRAAGEEWLARALHDHLDEAERRTVIAAMALLRPGGGGIDRVGAAAA